MSEIERSHFQACFRQSALQNGPPNFGNFFLNKTESSVTVLMEKGLPRILKLVSCRCISEAYFVTIRLVYRSKSFMHYGLQVL